MKSLLTFIFLIIAVFYSSGQTLNVSAGRLIRIENFPSHYIQPRNIDIWLPNGYTFSKKYRVLYMHDGQMLFNTNQSPNHQEWKVDETLDSLIAKSAIHECIVIGIWNTGPYKLAEYFPAKALDNLSSKRRKLFEHDELKSKPLADEYLKFIVHELKPYVDNNFSVYRDPENTFMAGSDAGALISLYAVCEYPDLFHSAACISNYCYQADNHIHNAILKYLKNNIPDPTSHRFYFDFDSLYQQENSKTYQLNLMELFTKKKYNTLNYLSKEFINESRNEEAVSRRLYLPMMFLLGKKTMSDER